MLDQTGHASQPCAPYLKQSAPALCCHPREGTVVVVVCQTVSTVTDRKRKDNNKEKKEKEEDEDKEEETREKKGKETLRRLGVSKAQAPHGAELLCGMTRPSCFPDQVTHSLLCCALLCPFEPAVTCPLQKTKKGKGLKPGSHTDAVLALSWNQEYRNVLASGSADSTVKVWDLAAEQCSATLEHHSDKVQAVAWNPAQPAVLLSGGFDQAVCMVRLHWTRACVV